MTKLKIPLLSLGAAGPLASTLSFDRRLRQNRVRSKPFPTDPKSLAQMYQRWQYQDYVALWLALSAAAKQTWETNARRSHMTGFAYFMRSNLHNRTDIRGLWHLDASSGALAKDFSPYLNHAAIYGTLPSDGVIDGAVFFDGTDDYLLVPRHTSLEPLPAFSIELFLKILSHGAGEKTLIQKGAWRNKGYHLFWNKDYNLFFFAVYNVGQDDSLYFSIAPENEWVHLVCVYDDRKVSAYLNADLKANHTTAFDMIHNTDKDLYIGTRSWGNFWANCLIDHLTLYGRALTPADIKRHSERRYPL